MSVQAEAHAQGMDSRQFSIEKGRLRLASVARQNPLSDDAFTNPMYHEAGVSRGEYDTASVPMAVNPLFRTSFGESTTDSDRGYDKAGRSQPAEYDAAGRFNGSANYDQAGRSQPAEYDVAGRSNGSANYDQAGRSKPAEYDVAGRSNGSANYDQAGRSQPNQYDSAGRMNGL